MKVWRFNSTVCLYMTALMMTSPNGNIFRVTGHLCGPRWTPRTKALTRSFDVFFDLRLNERLRKHSWGWWFDTLPRPLWRHSNALVLSRREHRWYLKGIHGLRYPIDNNALAYTGAEFTMYIKANISGFLTNHKSMSKKWYWVFHWKGELQIT